MQPCILIIIIIRFSGGLYQAPGINSQVKHNYVKPDYFEVSFISYR